MNDSPSLSPPPPPPPPPTLEEEEESQQQQQQQHQQERGTSPAESSGSSSGGSDHHHHHHQLESSSTNPILAPISTNSSQSLDLNNDVQEQQQQEQKQQYKDSNPINDIETNNCSSGNSNSNNNKSSADIIDDNKGTNTISCWKQLITITDIIASSDEDCNVIEEHYNDFTRAINLLAETLTANKLLENDNEPISESRFHDLIKIADIILAITLKRTATEPCDNIKLNFVDFYNLLTALSSLDQCKNHTKLLSHAIRWLDLCAKYLNDNLVFAQSSILDTPTERIKLVLDASCSLLDYISNILDVLKYLTSISSSKAQDLDGPDYSSSLQPDWVDEGPCFNIGDDDDESLIDDSDDESLCNKLCTFTLTQKQFVNQHWYHCHTCNMIDRVGVCTVCAKVCHKDHDVSYAKYGAFFCDCAGRDNNNCIALVKRAPIPSREELNYESSLRSNETDIASRDNKLNLSKMNLNNQSIDSRDMNMDSKKASSFQQQFAKQLEPYKKELLGILSSSNTCAITSTFLTSLIPAYVRFANNESHIGRSKRARAALEDLHSVKKTFHMTEALMLPTLGSQEGAFENVRVNYSGEHAGLIKQLLGNNTIRRVAMTSLSSPSGKRQHLVVCHEKGKITLLQLNALLRQADSSKRKLTLTRLSSAPIPFSVISIVANPFNEDVLAVSGLKDCHILTFTSNGLVSSHIELHLELGSASDYIIKTVWLPGGQSEIAVLTSEMVKIFDLSENSSQPKYHFKIASGLLKDITFIVPESKSTRYILIMNTLGHIFQQEFASSTASFSGAFYVTSELHLDHPNLKENTGTINGGGISLYYSHSFKILFFSYFNGNFMASMSQATKVNRVFSLDFDFSNSSSSQSSNQTSYASVTAASSVEGIQQDETQQTGKLSTKSSETNNVQPLCQWSEVSGHVGLIMAVCYHSNNPVILMLTPECIFAQEIRYLTIKSRITDATAIRHTTSCGEVRTTLILLCEDGSLRIYMASQELTDFWLKMSLNPQTALGIPTCSFLNKHSKKRKVVKASKNTSNSGPNFNFPVDFFENLQVMNDVDFGGADILSIYSVQQVKNRLNSSGMYITCTKTSGFSIEIINNDPNMVICGLQIQVGSQDLSKSPASIEIFGRNIPLNPQTSRWYDIPLTREESLQTDKRLRSELTVAFDSSPDPNGITFIDSIKVYGKTKESFSWPDDGDDQVNSIAVADDFFGSLLGQNCGRYYQKLLANSLESLDCSLNLNLVQTAHKNQFDKLAKELSLSLLSVPYSPQLVKSIKSLLLTVYSSRAQYSQQRDLAALEFVMSGLAAFRDGDTDEELFARVVFIMKSLCQSKLSNLTKLSECLAQLTIEKDPNLASTLTTESSKIDYLITHLHDLFWHLYATKPTNLNLTSVASSGFINYEDTLQPLIELIYIATLHDLAVLSVATDVIIGFLLSDDIHISLCARHTLIKLLRVKGNQHNNEPTLSSNNPQINSSDADNQTTNLSTDQAINTLNNRASLISAESNVLINPERFESIPEQQPSVGSQQSSIASQLRNVLRDHVEGVRHDNEDDIAIAIALSLQDDSQNNSVTDNAVTAAPTTSGRSELNLLSDRMPSAEELMSDTTASGVASDEDISASGPKSAPVDRNLTNRSLDYAPSTSIQDVETTVGNKSTPFNADNEIKQSNDQKSGNFKQERLRQQHLMLLERLIEHLPDTRDAGGFRSISLLHVILVLTLDLDCDNEVDDAILKNLLHALRQELLYNTSDTQLLVQRSSSNEVKLVIMRMFSILMSKVRTSSVASAVSCSTRAETDSCWSTFCSSITVMSLIESNVMEFCYNVLKDLVPFWKTATETSSNQLSSPMLALISEPIVPVNRRTLPKSLSQSQTPDLSPFFLRQYVKGHGMDLFEDYSQLLTEMVLRIPYQIKKVSSSSSNNLKPVVFSTEWTTILCEYLMIPIPSYIKKHVRKLLTFICGSKDKYRQLRDFHFLESHMSSVKQLCGRNDEPQVHNDNEDPNEIRTINLSYEAMTSLVEHLKSCIEIAQNRYINWQLYCFLKDQSLLNFLMKISLNFGEDVSPIVLELLQHALSSSQITTNQNMSNLLEQPIITTATTEVMNDQAIRDTLTSESLSADLAQQLITSISKDVLSRFVQIFLLETNLTSLRWQAHSLLYNLWLNFLPEQQLELVMVLWSLWHNLSKYGRKAAQFVDLVGFVTLKSPHSTEDYDKMFCQEALGVLRQQNQLLINHPNAPIYCSIQGLVDVESYYLENEPCSVCNSPEVSYNNIKLSSIKVDSRFTTTTQIIKLIGSHTILKFSLRVSDIKRSKMLKTITIYYNNKSVQSVVELKNKSSIWNLARRYSLSPNQTDVKIEFTLPIVACNLMIEFSEFYENFQASSETLQCPRCSTSVSANPGVCSNCGENVFQCHKCRAINYDEKDPFLCISCGFCKYARFDISLTAKPTCAVDSIENEEDRKKTVISISNLLEKADRVYKSLVQNKPTLELLLLRIHEQVIPDRHFDESIFGSDQSSFSIVSGTPNPTQQNTMQAQSIVVGYAPPTLPAASTLSVNKAIQHLAQKYCVECKGSFEELSKITHKILALRRELVEYDNRQLKRCLNAKSSVLSSANRRKSRVYSSLTSGSGRCYGCAIATVEHCVTMLKALSTTHQLRVQICDSGCISELVNFNLKHGSSTISREVRELLSLLTRGDINSTTLLTDLLMEKVGAISKQDYQPFEISHIVRHEIALLSVTLDSDDQCWELRLKCLIRIFAFAFELKNPTVMECLIIPCLGLLLSIIRPPSPTTRRHKEKSVDNIASVRSDSFRSRILLQEWLTSSTFVFEDWRRRATRPTTLTQGSKQIKTITSILRRSHETLKSQYRSNYLTEKYGNRWRLRCSKFNKISEPIASLPNDWLKRLLFNRSSKTVRLMTKSLVEALFSVNSRRNEIIDLLTSYLNELGPAGECAQEFYHLYKNIILTDHWRYYLALQGILLKIAGLITVEIDSLQELEETTLNTSLSLGYSLKMLVELLTSFIAVSKIRSHYKSKLVGFVLKGYLSLRRLVVQRTKVIDETQEMLLELLEGMTTGSESETAAFITVCVEAIKNCSESDIRTPVFIFERLCSTIHPEENIHSEFFVSLEKDPQQEDYLQGRMLGNPYSSNEAGVGPLMKDIKNKICQDCELLALLEDDSSMELLVSNKIISLDLPVRDVYKRIWCPENHESDAMRIVYRMRGLLGDATEEFIESFDSRNSEEVDEEQLYKMADIMSASDGIEIMLHRLKQIDDLSPPFRPLLDVILKLFSYCTKTKNNRLKLLSLDLMAVNTLLDTLKLALNEEDFLEFADLPKGVLGLNLLHPTTSSKNSATSTPSAKTRVIDQILEILETILREATKQPKVVFQEFSSKTCGSIEDVKFLMNSALVLCSRLSHVSHKIIQVLPFLTLGDLNKMSVLIDYFKPSIDFDKFDQEHSAINDSTIDLFCIMVDAIERNDNGNQLKDFIVTENIVADSMKYLTTHAPPLKSSLLATSDEWKEFTSRPALKYILRILGGLSQGHASTQVLISRDCIPVVHGLEQVSSDARVGTLAENLLEAIKQHPSVAEKIELVRKQTKEEKKRLAMAVRERQLGALGMEANERGQVTAKSKLLEQCQDLAEDSGLICNICREGYKFQPAKVLGIYTYTKRCVLDEFEMKPRKTYGYTTVTHFNTVHVECHMSAVRSARGRDEWDSAALQNANTRCNGLLPIWGPQVLESAYANALARHNSYLQDSTGYRDIGYHSTVQDVRLQLLRFAQERSFSEDTGGGGPQSNLHLIPYMMQTALYVLNSTKAATREYKRTLNYLEMSSNEVLENCYDVDSPYYWTTLAALVLPPTWWKKKRTQFLQRLLVCNHVRRVNIKPPAPMSDTRVRSYAYYKSALIFFAIIDSFYNIVFKDAVKEDKWNQDWSASLADYLKQNDQIVNDNIEVLLNLYQNSLLTCTSIDRFIEIIRLEEVSQPSDFLANTLESV